MAIPIHHLLMSVAVRSVMMRCTAMFIVALLAFGCSSQKPSEVHNAQSLATAAEVHAAVRQAASAPRAIVFIDVPWAFMEQPSAKFEAFAKHWRRTHPNTPIDFHCIDFSEACEHCEPIIELPGYDDWRREAGRHPFGGSGEWVWISKGVLTDIGAVFDAPVEELTARTEAAFDINGKQK